MPTKKIILMYHNIGVPPSNAKMKGLYVLPSMFKVQMWLLKLYGFKVVTVSDLVNNTQNKHDEKLVALTFDDGYEDFYKNALPILNKYGYPATVFVVSSLIGKTNEWDFSRYGGVEERLMNTEQLLHIQDAGIEIGSHSFSHKDLTRLSEDEMRQEILGSKVHLESILKKPVEVFCYPFGGCNQAVKEMVKDCNYKVGIGSKRGSVFLSDDIYEMRRIPIRLNTHPLLFTYKVLSGFEDRKGRTIPH